MSGGETSLSGTDDNSLALEYTPGYESVFINGVLQVRGSDYVATDGTTVTGLTALTASDVVMVESIVAYSVGDTYTQAQISSLLDAKSDVSTTGLVLLNTTIFSASSSVSIDNCFSSTYQNYRFVLDLDSASASATSMGFRLRTSGTDSSASYSYYGFEPNALAATIYTFNSGSATKGAFGYQTSEGGLFTVDVANPFIARATSYTSAYSVTSAGYATIGGWSAGSHRVSTSYDGLSIIPASGTITGTIKVYGYK